MSTRSGLAHGALRTCAASLSMAALAVSYSVLSVFYFYQDFFQYLGNGAPTSADRTGWMVLVEAPASMEGYYVWTLLSPWRMVAAGLAVALLGVSAAALWRNRPRARVLSMITLWGVLLPQVLWYTEFLVDWHAGQGLGQALLLAVAVCAVPTLLLTRPGKPLADWSCVSPGRLLGFAIASAWIGFAASEYIDHSYQLVSWTAYGGALAAIVLSALAVKGIYHLRSWGLVAGIGAAAALAVIPLSASWTSYTASGIGQGYIDGLRAATAGSDLRVALSMIVPLAVLWILAAPFLHGFVRRLRAAS